MTPNGPVFRIDDWLFRSHWAGDGGDILVWQTDCGRLSVRRRRGWSDGKVIERYFASVDGMPFDYRHKTPIAAMRACVDAVQAERAAA